MKFGQFFLLLLVLVVLGVLLYSLYHWILRKIYAKTVTTDDILPIIRKVQVVDVREPEEYARKHILGARNIPSSQFKYLYSELRKDTPIYLYCDNMERSARAAKILAKNDYEDIHILKDGIDSWYGRTKSEN